MGASKYPGQPLRPPHLNHPGSRTCHPFAPKIWLLCEIVINSAASWNQLFFVSLKCKKELLFIKDHFSSLKSCAFDGKRVPKVLHSRILASDASLSGLGTIELDGGDGFHLVHQLVLVTRSANLPRKGPVTSTSWDGRYPAPDADRLPPAPGAARKETRSPLRKPTTSIPADFADRYRRRVQRVECLTSEVLPAS